MAPLRFKRTTLLLIGLWLGGFAAWFVMESSSPIRPHGARSHSEVQAVAGVDVQAWRNARTGPVAEIGPVTTQCNAGADTAMPHPIKYPNPPTPTQDDVHPACPNSAPPPPVPLPEQTGRPLAEPDTAREALELFHTARRENSKYWAWLDSLPCQPVRAELHHEYFDVRRAYDEAMSALKDLPTYQHKIEVRGTVTDEIGNPIPGASVFAYLRVGSGRLEYESSSDWIVAYGDIFRSVSLGRADESGHFALSHTLVLRCPPEVTIDLHAEDSARTKSGVVALLPGHHHEFASLVCPRTGDLEFELLSPENEPIEGAAIVLDWEPLDPAAGAKGTYEHSLPRTDEHGRMQATGIAAGRRLLRLTGPGYWGLPPVSVTIVAGQTATAVMPRVHPRTGLFIQFMRGQWADRDVELMFRDVSGLGRPDLRITAQSDEHGRSEIALDEQNEGTWDVFDTLDDDNPALLGRVTVRRGKMMSCDLGDDPTR